LNLTVTLCIAVGLHYRGNSTFLTVTTASAGDLGQDKVTMHLRKQAKARPLLVATL